MCNNKEKYNKVVHNITNCQGAHPSKFVPISSLNTVICKYEKAFKNRKISGYQGGFGGGGGGEDKDTGVVDDVVGELKPFSDFVCGINSLLYLHNLFISFQMSSPKSLESCLHEHSGNEKKKRAI